MRPISRPFFYFWTPKLDNSTYNQFHFLKNPWREGELWTEYFVNRPAVYNLQNVSVIIWQLECLDTWSTPTDKMAPDKTVGLLCSDLQCKIMECLIHPLQNISGSTVCIFPPLYILQVIYKISCYPPVYKYAPVTWHITWQAQMLPAKVMCQASKSEIQYISFRAAVHRVRLALF